MRAPVYEELGRGQWYWKVLASSSVYMSAIELFCDEQRSQSEREQDHAVELEIQVED